MFKINFADMLFGAIGIAIGVYLNRYYRQIEDQKLLDSLKSELESINHQQIVGRSTTVLEKKKAEIEGSIKILQK